MDKATESNKALVLKAFDALFNKRLRRCREILVHGVYSTQRAHSAWA